MSATEYLPQPGEDNGQPHAERKFSIQPVKAPVKKPYELREQVWLCDNTEQKLGAFSRLLFTRLTDMAMKPDFRHDDGVVRCSKKFLADEYHCAVTTITRATRQLEDTGFLWTHSVWNGAFEITFWYIREWADDRYEHKPHVGDGYGKRQRGVRRNVARDGDSGRFVENPASARSIYRRWSRSEEGQKWLQGQPSNPPPATVKPNLHPVHGQECTLTGSTDAPGPGAEMHPVHGQERPRSGGKNAPGPGAWALPDRVQKRSRTGSADAPGQGAKTAGLKDLKRESTSKSKTPSDGEGGDPHPEKLSWEGKWWWPSQLTKFLDVAEEAVKRAEPGDERRAASAKRNSLLAALGLPVPRARSARPAPAMPVPPPATPASQLKGYVAALRAAVKEAQ